MIALVVVAVLIAGITLALLVILGVEPGIAPEDVVIAYETAYDHLDFDGMWTLSSATLRDGMGRREFARNQRAFFGAPPGSPARAATVEVESYERDGDTARARTCVHLLDGTALHNELNLLHVGDGWRVDSYLLTPE